MIKKFIFFCIITVGLYASLVTYHLIVNNQFTHEYKWALITAVYTSLSLSIAEYFYERKKKKKLTSKKDV